MGIFPRKTHNREPELAQQEGQDAPEHGLPGQVIRITIIMLVLTCMLLSGYGNIVTWTAGVEGVDYWIAFGTGIISEIIGAVLLVVIIWCFARPSIPRLLMALLFFPVWSMATFQNASASWSYYVDASNAEEQASAQRRALEQKSALKTQSALAAERIEEIKEELSFIGMTRTPDEIKAQRDRLPENYVTKRAQLSSELNKAERRIFLDNELIEQRDILAKATGAGANIEVSTSIVGSKGATPLPISADGELKGAQFDSVWGFLQFVQSNRLGSLVLVMEIMKSFGLLLVNVVFVREAQSRAMQNAQPQANIYAPAPAPVAANDGRYANAGQANAPIAPVAQGLGPKRAKVVQMSAPQKQNASVNRAPASSKQAPKPTPEPSAFSFEFAGEDGVQLPSQSYEEPEIDTAEEGDSDEPHAIGIASKFV
ncbi:hypothetical protein [Hirschia baltica]|uniref:Uncharacterized protein n=1 Tax=Hirschia baltica (strain ATCC 49814 / DSM 5838 / IFAM 1418) TaxID=582402 RepID=C6XS02_HIRBI|nr:hypothetical protein [Hirschia baltica]ACT60843.1 hypothetical protein Hbal_3176 [Hirschia baltica ATCC 49814]